MVEGPILVVEGPTLVVEGPDLFVVDKKEVAVYNPVDALVVDEEEVVVAPSREGLQILPTLSNLSQGG